LTILVALGYMVVERAFFGGSTAFKIVKWGRCAPHTAQMRQIGHEVVQEVL
jgi:hypothetical protein